MIDEEAWAKFEDNARQELETSLAQAHKVAQVTDPIEANANISVDLFGACDGYTTGEVINQFIAPNEESDERDDEDEDESEDDA